MQYIRLISLRVSRVPHRCVPLSNGLFWFLSFRVSRPQRQLVYAIITKDAGKMVVERVPLRNVPDPFSPMDYRSDICASFFPILTFPILTEFKTVHTALWVMECPTLQPLLLAFR